MPRRRVPPAFDPSAVGPSNDPEPFCAVHDAMRLLQGKWTLQIIRALLGGPHGFNDLARAVGGCNPATLARRLEALGALGILSKRIESTMPPRTCYTLTEAGLALDGVVDAIEAWGERYLQRPERRSTKR